MPTAKERTTSTRRSDDEVRERLELLASRGLDINVDAVLSRMDAFREAVGDAAARTHMIATSMKSCSGVRMDFSGDVGDDRGSWSLPLKALRAVFEAVTGTRVTESESSISPGSFQRVAIEANQPAAALPECHVEQRRNTSRSSSRARKRAASSHRRRSKKRRRRRTSRSDSPGQAQPREAQQSRSPKRSATSGPPWESTPCSLGAPGPLPVLSAAPVAAASAPLPQSQARHSAPQVTDWVLRVGSLTVEAIDSWCAAAGGAEKLRSILDAVADGQQRANAPLVAGAAWCIAFALACKEWVPADQFRSTVSVVAESGGNALKCYDQVNVARFFAMYPKAAECAAAWAATPCALGALAISSIAVALSQSGDAVPGRWLCDALEWPTTAEALYAGIQRLAKCSHKHTKRSERLQQLHAHLTDKGVPLASIPAAVQSLAESMWSSAEQQQQAGPVLAPRGTAATTSVTSVASGVGMPPVPPLANARSPTAAAVPNASHQHRGKKQKLLPCDVDTFSDLRVKYKPIDPRLREQEFTALVSSPTPPSPKGTTVLKFDAPEGVSDREVRWHAWEQLSRIGCFVRQYYAGTDYETFGNASAGLGSKGQYVVFTDAHGTLMIMATGRVYSPSPVGDLIDRLGLILKPFPFNDQSTAGLAGDKCTKWAAALPPQSLNFSFGQN